jgi:hypothetical protein
MLTKDASYYAVADYRLHRGGLPLGWLVLLAQPGAVLSLVLFGLVFLLFPDGRPPSRRWRWVLWLYAVWPGVDHLDRRHHGGRDHRPPPAGRFRRAAFLLSGNDPASGWWNAALGVFILLVAVCLVRRWRARWPAGGARPVSAASS